MERKEKPGIGIAINDPGTVHVSFDMFPLDSNDEFNLLKPVTMEIYWNAKWKSDCIITIHDQEYLIDRSILKGLL